MRNRGSDGNDIVWKPVFVMPLLSLEGRECGCSCMAFMPDMSSSYVVVGSFDGELLQCDFVTPPDVEHPEYAKSTHLAFAGVE